MKIMILGGKGESTYAVINALSGQYVDVLVVLEDPVPIGKFFKRRIKRLGLFTVIGQMIFLSTVPKRLRKKSKDRIDEISEIYNLDTSESFKNRLNVEYVESVNSDKTISLIDSYQPDFVVVNGTRIISADTLNAINAPIINMHTGITPKYRGVHGGYWAVVNDDKDNCGVTVHFVNTGIDTGGIIKQARIPLTDRDNYITYPRLQTGEGIRLELETLKEYTETGIIKTMENDLPSKIWSHPTILQYYKNRKKR